jgi:hypothetical protein
MNKLFELTVNFAFFSNTQPPKMHRKQKKVAGEKIIQFEATYQEKRSDNIRQMPGN